MSIEQDLAAAVSDDMVTVIAEALDQNETEQAVTLAHVLEAAYDGLIAELAEQGRVEDDEEELYRELHRLIEDYGDDTPAGRFVRSRASDVLSTVIEAEVDNHDASDPPTLASVRDAMHSGLLAHLVGTGDIAAEDEQPLYAEIDSLIQRHGESAAAEEFLL